MRSWIFVLKKRVRIRLMRKNRVNVIKAGISGGNDFGRAGGRGGGILIVRFF